MLKAIAWRVELTVIGAIVVWQAVSSVMFVFNSIKGVFQ